MQGVSTRSVDDLVQAMGMSGISKSQVSRLCGEIDCQPASKLDPSSASNFDPFVRRGLAVALVSSELAGIAEARRARVM